MTDPSPDPDLDRTVRQLVFDACIRAGRPPLRAAVATALGRPDTEVAEALQRLADGHVCVLQASGEILMAFPFSAVPTAFRVQAGQQDYFGNCIWDGFGIIAMLGQDAELETSCADCGSAMRLRVRGGQLDAAPGVAHFAVPARRWFDDPVFT